MCEATDGHRWTVTPFSLNGELRRGEGHSYRKQGCYKVDIIVSSVQTELKHLAPIVGTLSSVPWPLLPADNLRPPLAGVSPLTLSLSLQGHSLCASV